MKKTCPKCYKYAEKYFYFNMNFYWKCTNKNCPVLDIEHIEDKKPSWIEPEEEKTEIKSDTADLSSSYFLRDDDDSMFITQVTLYIESLGYQVYNSIFRPDGLLIIITTGFLLDQCDITKIKLKFPQITNVQNSITI